MIDVETPDGKTFAIDDPALIDNLRVNIDGNHELTLLRSGQGDHRLSSVVDLRGANGEETGRGNRRRRR